MFNESVYGSLLPAISLMFGVLCAFLFDCFRALRKVARSGTLAVFAEDALFWLATTLCFFALCLKYNDGKIRLFTVAAATLGAVLYFKTISRFTIRFLVYAANLIRKLFRMALKAAFFPLKILLRLLNRPFFFAVTLGKTSILKTRKRIFFAFKKFIKFTLFPLRKILR